jgi:hypothetical protein
MSLLLMVWGGFRLVVKVSLRFAIITRFCACGVWVFAAFWGPIFQLAVSLFIWIKKVTEDIGEKVVPMLSAEALHGRTAECLADQA